jgi:hypothetical protein
MKWNVLATVVDVIEAETGDEAVGKLEGMLREKGFEVYEVIDYVERQWIPAEE